MQFQQTSLNDIHAHQQRHLRDIDVFMNEFVAIWISIEGKIRLKTLVWIFLRRDEDLYRIRL